MQYGKILTPAFSLSRLSEAECSSSYTDLPIRYGHATFHPSGLLVATGSNMGSRASRGTWNMERGTGEARERPARPTSSQPTGCVIQYSLLFICGT